MPKLEAIVKGIKLQQAKKRDTTKARLTITPSILLRLRSVWEKNSGDYESIMLWTACYFGGDLCVQGKSLSCLKQVRCWGAYERR